jgi:hypothetical protein
MYLLFGMRLYLSRQICPYFLYVIIAYIGLPDNYFFLYKITLKELPSRIPQACIKH